MQGCVHIVDDDASFRKAVERRLTKAGYEVATYASAQQLLDSLPTESVPSCIILDVRIPGLGGPETKPPLFPVGRRSSEEEILSPSGDSIAPP